MYLLKYKFIYFHPKFVCKNFIKKSALPIYNYSFLFKVLINLVFNNIQITFFIKRESHSKFEKCSTTLIYLRLRLGFPRRNDIVSQVGCVSSSKNRYSRVLLRAAIILRFPYAAKALTLYHTWSSSHTIKCWRCHRYGSLQIQATSSSPVSRGRLFSLNFKPC